VPEPLLRPATPVDVPALVALVRSAYRGDESRTGWTTEADLLDDERIDAAGVLAKIDDPATTVLVAVDGAGELIACCEVQLRSGGVGYFGMFAVRPDLQAAGRGRRVLAAAEQHAAALGATTMEMTVIAQRTELVEWYVRRGYTLTGETRPFPYGGAIGGGNSRRDLYFVVLRKALPDRRVDDATSAVPGSVDRA